MNLFDTLEDYYPQGEPSLALNTDDTELDALEALYEIEAA